MRTRILAAWVMCTNVSIAQTSAVFTTAYDRATEHDTSMCVAGISLSVKVSENKPETLTKAKVGGGTVEDSHPRKFRYQPRGEMTILVYPRRDALANFQPHVLIDVVGLSSYLSAKIGTGATFRDYRLSFGLVLGNYLRRLDIDNPDLRFRTKPFEASQSWGGYFHHDNDYFTWFATLSKEKSYGYYEVMASFKVGKFLQKKLSGIALEFSSETFLGTGLGVAYTTPNGHNAFTVSYCIPQSEEVNRQRHNDVFIGEGLNIRWHSLSF